MLPEVAQVFPLSPLEMARYAGWMNPAPRLSPDQSARRVLDIATRRAAILAPYRGEVVSDIDDVSGERCAFDDCGIRLDDAHPSATGPIRFGEDHYCSACCAAGAHGEDI